MRLRSIVKPALVVFLGFVLYVIASNVGAGWLYVIVAALAGVVLISAPCLGSACGTSASLGAPLSWRRPANLSSAPWRSRTGAASPGTCSKSKTASPATQEG